MREPLQIDERVKLGDSVHARFDGEHIVLDIAGLKLLRLDAIMLARLIDLNRRIQDSFPTRFLVDLDELLRQEDQQEPPP